jgi:2-polyprenyl-3-methyl-5-hydroxy-6-metoxy-1,4-benzoquinol methylase
MKNFKTLGERLHMKVAHQNNWPDTQRRTGRNLLRSSLGAAIYCRNPFPVGCTRLYDFALPYVLSRISHGSRVLEVGVGNGDLALEICASCGPNEFVGIDIEPHCVSTASERLADYHANIFLKDAESFDLFRCLGPFDVIVCRNTFHHFERKVEFLSNVKEQGLREGGKLLLLDLDGPANFDYCGLGLVATFLRALFSIGPLAVIRTLISTRCMLKKEIREHRNQDAIRLRNQGWFRYRDVIRNIAEVLPDAKVTRLGSILELGGCYGVEYSQTGKRPK